MDETQHADECSVFGRLANDKEIDARIFATDVSDMPTVEKQLAMAAPGLPPKKRAKLADLLTRSLVSSEDSDTADAWNAEAVSRAKAHKRVGLKAVSVEVAVGFKL